MKKILSKTKNDGKSKPIAFIHGDDKMDMIEIKRGDQIFKIVGSDFSIIATAPNNPNEKQAIFVESGKVKAEGLEIEEVEEKKNDNPDDKEKDDKKNDDQE
jgi:hypothetical protein